MKVAAFPPNANWQTACLGAYQNDDLYVVACRDYVDGQIFEAWHETAASPAALAQVPGSDTISILLRLDRNPSTEAIGAFFSVNDGASWTALGASIVKSLANPRLAIFIGANGSTSSFPTADINWVEIVANP